MGLQQVEFHRELLTVLLCEPYSGAMANYRISVEKDYLSFSAAHFLVFGKKCERLHGHNYAVAVELEGDLDAIGYVFDFTELKRMAKAECDSLDHRMLLPTENEHLRIEDDGQAIVVSYRTKRFSFPKEDVLLLPVKNITAELLAAYLAGRLAYRLSEIGAANVSAVSIMVYEAPGQSALHRKTLK